MKRVQLHLETPINSGVLLNLTDYLPYIEILELWCKLSHLNLDSLFNLKRLRLSHTIMNHFNFYLFDYICNRLESITISCSNFDYKCIEKLFYRRDFAYLTTLYIVHSSENIKLEKKLFNRLPKLQKLKISFCKNVQIIDNDVFSNLIQLEELYLSDICIDKSLFSNLIKLKKLTLCRNRLESIEENSFSNLHNLEYIDLKSNGLKSLSAKSFIGLDKLKRLDLSHNELVNFDLDIFDNIGKTVEIYLNENPIINKDEIFNRSAQSKIKVYI